VNFTIWLADPPGATLVIISSNYLRLRTMSRTIYAAKFEQTIIHQHVYLRRESQSHAPAHVIMRLYPIDKSLVCLQSERRTSFSNFKHKLCATLYVNVNIHYRLPIKVYYRICTLKALLHGKASIAILVSCNFLYHDPCQFTH
jgi:hypothetical protein